jgi:thymidylate synthase ThyX
LQIGGSTKKVRKKSLKKSSKKSSKKKFKKKFEKMFEKKFAKKVRKYYKLSEGGVGWGGWRIVIPMPEAINFVDGRRQKKFPKVMITESDKHSTYFTFP